MSQRELVDVRSSESGRLIQASVIPELSDLAQGIVRQFEGHGGERRDGFTIWMGWGPCTLRANGDGFVITSPNYASDPTREETADLTLAVWILVSLTKVTSGANVEPAGINFTDDVICVKDWEQAPMLAMSRKEREKPRKAGLFRKEKPTQTDSGWFIEPFPPAADRNWTADQLVRVPAWRVLQQRRPVATALGLPAGVSAIIQDDDVRAVVRESDREVLWSPSGQSQQSAPSRPQSSGAPQQPAYSVVPDEQLTDEQRRLAAIGRELFGRMARKAGVVDNAPIAVVPIEDGAVVTVRQVRGGGKIYVAPDGSAFFLGSAVDLVTGIQEFRAGARTPIEKFGPAG